MRLLKAIFLLSVLPLIFSSCGDEITNEYYIYPEGKFNVNIKSGAYTLVTIHKSYLDSNYVPTGVTSRDHTYGMKFQILLDKPSERNNIKSLKIASGYHSFECNEQELQDSYVDSLGGYELSPRLYDDLPYNILDNSALIWNASLYSASGDVSNIYPLIVDGSNAIEYMGFQCFQYSDTLHVIHQVDSGTTLTIHLLDSAGVETGVYKFSKENPLEQIIPNPPHDAVQFYFIYEDTYKKIKRIYISGKRAIDFFNY